GVTFLGEVVSWDGETDILQLGISVSLVIAALSIVFANIRRHHEHRHEKAPAEE
nr:hypothetical protein [Chloroflexia bacterium]